jgi:hypothetical protein
MLAHLLFLGDFERITAGKDERRNSLVQRPAER